MISGDSSKVEQLPFQVEDDGSNPISPLHYLISICNFADISHVFKKYHYKSDHMGGGISYCFALHNNLEVLGGATLGNPRHNNYSINGKKVIEIRRFACLDKCPKNTESYFLSKIIWWLKKNTNIDDILSYADQSVGHKGIIYKASNFKYIGKTTPSKHIFWKDKRYHPRSLSIDRPYSYILRNAVKTEEAIIETGLPKLIYIYSIKRK